METFDRNKYAKIHSIESFGTVDGPGIRFVIFMQGCALKCKYCHNRDTWDICGGTLTSTDELLDKIERYKSYILRSGGGVTVSGGEPLLQPKFLITLFRELQNRNIPTAIDTSGMVDLTDEIKELLSLTDLVLLDIKHINDEKSKNLVGFSNKKELAFAKYLSDNNIPVWIRQVIIPGITDDENDLIELKEFINSLKNVEKVELMPYHELGKFKWKNLGFEYELDGIPSATAEDIQKAKRILEI
jgi:pyruvate formate lyase activating enzyme